MTPEAMKFEFDNFRLGTDNQKGVGIHATFTLNLRNADGVIVTLEDVRLRKTKDKDEWYIEGPYTEYTKADGTKGKRHYYRVWPDRTNFSRRDPLVAQAREMYTKLLASGNTSFKQQQQTPTATTQTREKSPW